MNPAFGAICFLALLLVLVGIVKAFRAVRYTTLRPALFWAFAAWACWFAAVVFDVLNRERRSVNIDLLWYAAAVLALCPTTTVLGARRPGASAWTWFVTLPMVLVLGLPAASAWWTAGDATSLVIETPAAIGFLLVLVMGAGNYIGTRQQLAPSFFALAITLMVVTFLPLLKTMPDERNAFRMGATVALGCTAGAGLIARPQKTGSGPFADFDVVFRAFRDAWGVVWARRLIDRVNQIAERENWNVRLTFDGLHPHVEDVKQISESKALGDPLSPQQLSEMCDRDRRLIERALRWLLSRFVEPEWIDQRLAVAHCRTSCGETGSGTIY